jgi:hypothetical protein
MQFFIVCLLALFGLATADTVNIYTDGNGTFVTVTNKNSDMSQDYIVQLVSVFFNVYLKEKAAYNPQATNNVGFIIDPTYDGVAYTSANETTFSSAYFAANPQDLDVVTHESFHIVQYGKHKLIV